MKRFFSLLLICLMLLPCLALAEEESKAIVLFSGSASQTFTTWDTWDKALALGNDQFDVTAFDKPFTITVRYESDGEPVLVLMSWTGGTSWAQMTPDYTERGVAYYSYATLCAHYGSDFSLLNNILVMPGGADVTVTELAFVYETATEEQTPMTPVTYTGPAGEIVSSIRAGWNLGNTLDSFGDWILSSGTGSPRSFETAWGNPVTTDQLMDDIKAAGFNAVRIPVTWTQHIADDGTYQIDSDWMARVQEVVDSVLARDMYCIINLHHDVGGDSWLKASDESIAQAGDKFCAVWTQIANHFAAYDEHLLFEGFNEILNEQNNWNYPGQAATTAVNTLNQLFVNTIRATGGRNASRVLLVNTYAAGTNVSSVADFVVPTDSAENCLIVEVHYYDPGAYCSAISGTSNTQAVWTENGGQAQVDRMLDRLYKRFTSQGIPVIIGEFGAANKHNAADRAEYAHYIVENAALRGIKCFWWDTGNRIDIDPDLGYYSGMALYDRYNHTWVFPEIVEAITGVNVTDTE